MPGGSRPLSAHAETVVSDEKETPPGCEPIAGGTAYKINDLGTFLDAMRPTVEVNMARANDADDAFSGPWMPYSEAWRHVEASIAAWRAGRGGRR